MSLFLSPMFPLGVLRDSLNKVWGFTVVLAIIPLLYRCSTDVVVKGGGEQGDGGNYPMLRSQIFSELGIYFLSSTSKTTGHWSWLFSYPRLVRLRLYNPSCLGYGKLVSLEADLVKENRILCVFQNCFSLLWWRVRTYKFFCISPG